MKWQLDVNATYQCDNGATYCGKHLGHTAATTGRDLSGMRIHRLTEVEVAESKADGWPISCETCGRAA